MSHGACRPRVGVVVSWVRAPCSVIPVVCPCGCAPVWCGPACVAGVGRGPYSGRPPPTLGGGPWHALACLTLALACADARLLARVCLACVCCVGLLVPVSSTGHPASTPGLSTRSSTGGLPHHPSGWSCGGLVSGMVSRLDAFSGYPSRTWPTSGAPGGTTGAPEVRPSRSSRTGDRSSQVSCARRG